MRRIRTDNVLKLLLLILLFNFTVHNTILVIIKECQFTWVGIVMYFICLYGMVAISNGFVEQIKTAESAAQNGQIETVLNK